ncbi:MAG: amino acid transporter substrate-binding protein [Tardiphaga sp.]|uniref:transporter substrate-binding domain-containing protein n=1 Tax=Tardiphaga sp. TaxID=1926292 RepID=UPI00261F03AE|nr:transporter substrate-binding domain-containing protein [Tardiphaga sp.]MDB5502709.1 amino acid transporter substrate-binding protein [Tardiphaga sp.]
MRLLRWMVALAMTTAVPAFAQAPSPEVLRDLAPTGTLRAAINFGNSVLAQKGPADAPRGVSVDLAAELAKRLGVPVAFVPYEAAGKVFEGARAGAWDVGFIAIEPVRSAEIMFTAPYVIIEGTYMVRADSPLKRVEEVDRPGIQIAVGLGSAYDLYLTRTIKNAAVLRANVGGGSAMIQKFLEDKLDVAAGVRQQLDAYAKDHPEMRVMPGHFQEINQAMGMPRVEGQPRAAGAAYLAAFVEEMKASGFVAEALTRSGQVAEVAPKSSK